MLELIFEDDENTIRSETNFYFEGLLQRKFLYENNETKKILEYKYDNKKILQKIKEYDYETYILIFNLSFI